MNENVNVCITPKGDKPVLHFSQFDNERVFTVTVLADDGESAAVLIGLDIEFRLRKTDSHVVTIAPESVADNVITFKTTEQLCACCGQNIASVVLMKDDMIISTLDILVDIQRDILSGGLTSESDIRNLTTQIETIIPEVLADDYYTKTEVDDIIADIPTFDPTNYYDKSDVNGLLADKADVSDLPDMSNYYTKSETDTALSTKADVASTYNMTQVNNLLSLRLPIPQEQEVQNLPASVVTLANAGEDAPLSELTVAVTAVQEGTGTPSPSNPRPISGFSGANIVRCGVNLANIRPYSEWSVIGSYLCYQNALPKDQNFYMSFADNDTSVDVSGCYFGFLDDEYSGGSITGHFKWILNNGTYTANNNLISGPKLLNGFVIYPTTEATYNKIMARYKIQVELGNTATTYKPYNGNTTAIPFGQTVYGGVLDVTNGKLTITHIKITDFAQYYRDFYVGTYSTEYRITLPYPSTTVNYSVKRGSLCNCKEEETAYYGANQSSQVNSARDIFAINPAGEILAIYDTDTTLTKATFEAKYSGNIEFVYELATPTEITLTEKEIDTLLHDNNIYSDTGDILSMKYIIAGSEDVFKYIRMIKG